MVKVYLSENLLNLSSQIYSLVGFDSERMC